MTCIRNERSEEEIVTRNNVYKMESVEMEKTKTKKKDGKNGKIGILWFLKTEVSVISTKRKKTKCGWKILIIKKELTKKLLTTIIHPILNEISVLISKILL
jgi:hypothetical protein